MPAYRISILIFFIVLISLSLCTNHHVNKNKKLFEKKIDLYLKKCFGSEINLQLSWECLKETLLVAFDDIISTKEIPFGRSFSFSTNTTENKSEILSKRGAKESIRKYRFLDGITGRTRRRHHMLPAMMFGITALGMIIVPIGFQILAIVSGKALLLAKMALLLASINGIKRVAASGVHYGLYQMPDTTHQLGHYERGDIKFPR